MNHGDSTGNPLFLGTILNTATPLDLSAAQRAEQLYGVGMPNVGKSKFIEQLVQQDIERWLESQCGLMLLDPHGGVFHAVMRWLAWNDHLLKHRVIVPIDLTSREWIVSYNPLRERPGADPGVIVRENVEALAHIAGQADTLVTQRFSRLGSDVLRILYANNLTLTDAYHLFDQKQKQLRQILLRRVANPMTLINWTASQDWSWKEFDELLGSTVNRLHPFVETQTMQAMFGQPCHSLDVDRALEEGWIILVNASTQGGMISTKDQWTAGTLLLNDLWRAAGNRGKGNKKPFYVFIDEFERFVSPTVAENFAEARGFGLHGCYFHQFPHQLLNAGEHGKRVFDAVDGCAGNVIGFRTRQAQDLDLIARRLFMGTFDPDEVKYIMRSRKVMDYVLEYLKSYGERWSKGVMFGGSDGSSGQHSSGRITHPDGRTVHSEQDGDAYQEQSTWSKTYTKDKSVNSSPLLRPVFGYEETPVFRPLDEQVFRAMAALFDQQQRQGVALLSGMKQPVSFEVPLVSGVDTSDEMVADTTAQLMERLPFALRRAEAIRRIEERRRTLVQELVQRQGALLEEPTSAAGPRPRKV